MKIGVTGIIGSGKSTFIDYVNKHNYQTFDSDKYVHKLYKTQAVIDYVEENFGCVTNNVVDRKCLKDIVFSNKARLEQLEAYIHPLVINEIKALDGLVFVDVPLLYETNLEALFDKIIVVACSNKVLVKRLMKRNNIDVNAAEALIKLQMPLEEKIAKADFVIYNDGSLDKFYKDINKVLEDLYV